MYLDHYTLMRDYDLVTILTFWRLPRLIHVSDCIAKSSISEGVLR
jgi:hypothetical protein